MTLYEIKIWGAHLGTFYRTANDLDAAYKNVRRNLKNFGYKSIREIKNVEISECDDRYNRIIFTLDTEESKMTEIQPAQIWRFNEQVSIPSYAPNTFFIVLSMYALSLQKEYWQEPYWKIGNFLKSGTDCWRDAKEPILTTSELLRNAKYIGHLRDFPKIKEA